jgi:CheY-like chemotaxis protein
MTQTAPARIALINDDTTYLQLMEDLLQAEEGYEVLVCKVSSGAYEFVKEQRPDLVLLDIRMETPEAGWMVLELLTLDPQTRDIPMIACSAAIRDLQDHEGLLKKYDIDVLPKPFDLDTLLEKVEAALTRRGRGVRREKPGPGGRLARSAKEQRSGAALWLLETDPAPADSDARAVCWGWHPKPDGSPDYRRPVVLGNLSPR